MNPARSPLDRFVSALHRRLIVVRALEAAAVGTAAGAALGGLLIPLLFWRGDATLAPTVAALVLGALTGLLWGFTRRPTRLQAAAEADRQLDLADLLATALAVRPKPRESDRSAGAAGWLKSVVCLADAACTRHTPSQVVLHRLHARAWGGIALAALLVLSVAALTTQEPAARAATGKTARPRVGQRAAGETTGGAEQGTPDRTSSRPASRSPGAGPGRADAPAASSVSQQGARDAAAASEALGDKPAAGSDNGLGGGSGRARMPGASEASGRPGNPTRQSASGNRGEAAGGAGAAAVGRRAADNPTGGTVAGAAGESTPPPPWTSTDWADDARRAREAVDAGRVPDARRGVVRDYFDPERR